jgi:RNA polymerase sigma-70 factor (ECF subfamily)
MARIREGEVAAFEELVRRYQKSLVNFFFRQSWDGYLAEDFAQEVFLRIFKAARNYRPTASFRTYLFSIARNYWIDHLRSKRNVRDVSLSGGAGGEDETRLVDVLSSDAGTPSESMGRDELGKTIRRAVDMLPEEQRMVFILCQVEGMKYADVAQIQGVPIGTVKSRMHAALGKLKSLLQGKVSP